MSKIIKNQIRCNHCKALVQSTHRHDFNSHQCETMQKTGDWIAADGGREYLRRVGNPEDWTETSIYDSDGDSHDRAFDCSEVDV